MRENRQKKADRKARKLEDQGYYCKLVNDRTGYSKLVSKEIGFKYSQGLIEPITFARIKPWKDAYSVEDI